MVKGKGLVTSSPSGIVCGSDCTESYPDGSTVTLIATPSEGSFFEGWSGDCTGEDTSCTVTVDGAKSVIATFNPAAESDLSLTQGDAPDPVTLGDDLTYTTTITNHGPDEATGVTVSNTLPEGVAFVSATASQGGCTEEGSTVTCDLGTLANGTTAAVTLVVTPMAEGTITNLASVTGNESDPNTANNAATQNTTVNPAVGPDLTGSWGGLTQSCKGAGPKLKCSIKGTFLVQNAGNEKAPKSFLEFYLSDDDTFDEDDPLLKRVPVAPLKAGKTKKSPLLAKLSTGMNASGQFVIAIVDVDDTVDETNETNNTIVFGSLR